MLNGFDCLVFGMIIIVIAILFAIMGVRRHESTNVFSYIEKRWYATVTVITGIALILGGIVLVRIGQ